MVSGFFTSPKDHERIMSGEARPILIASNSSVLCCAFRKFNKSFTFSSCKELKGTRCDWQRAPSYRNR
ncbi:Uncharacterised protein [Vibrio cholerae]|nr:Uncharacterised protein [Vibrio cholerae]